MLPGKVEDRDRDEVVFGGGELAASRVAVRHEGMVEYLAGLEDEQLVYNPT